MSTSLVLALLHLQLLDLLLGGCLGVRGELDVVRSDHIFVRRQRGGHVQLRLDHGPGRELGLGLRRERVVVGGRLGGLVVHLGLGLDRRRGEVVLVVDVLRGAALAWDGDQ